MALIHFIVKPFRTSIGPRWPFEEKKIAEITKDFDVHISRGRMHAEKLAEAAIESGAKLIVCVGGDSTLSEIANAIIRAENNGKKPPLLTYHSGFQSGETVRSLREQQPFIEFLKNYMEGNCKEEKMDVGEIEFTGEYGQKIKRIFLNAAGFGFSSTVIGKINTIRYSARKRAKIIQLILSRILFYRRPAVSIMKTNGMDESTTFIKDEEVLTGIAHNGRYAGYGLEFCPKANMTDGSFEFTLVKKALRYKYIFGVFPLLAGKLSDMSFVEQVSCKALEIRPSDPNRKVRVDFDGDCWGYLPAKIKVLPQRLALAR